MVLKQIDDKFRHFKPLKTLQCNRYFISNDKHWIPSGLQSKNKTKQRGKNDNDNDNKASCCLLLFYDQFIV